MRVVYRRDPPPCRPISEWGPTWTSNECLLACHYHIDNLPGDRAIGGGYHQRAFLMPFHCSPAPVADEGVPLN